MPFKKHDRQYDLIVLGATGYTGQLIAEYIVRHLPTNLKWAVAGRSEAKLKALVDDCKRLSADRPAPSIEIASVDNEAQVVALVKKTFILITSVGPFCLYGEPAFKACAETGTHYLDVTGEVTWTRQMIRKYGETAKANGAIMIPQIGFDSSPADLCTWSLARCLKRELGVYTKDVTFSMHKLNTFASGGTMATILASFDVYPLRELAAAQQPYATSPIPHEATPARLPKTLFQRIFGLRTIPNLGLVTTSFFGNMDIGLVERTWGTLAQTPSRKDEFYGPRFTWREFTKPRNWLSGIAFHWLLVVGISTLALFPFIRSIGKRVIYQSGQGPSKEDSSKDEVEFRAVADPDMENANGKQAFCQATYFGSIYYLTGVFVGSAAWTMLEDDLKLDGGVYTPACLGQTFVDRTRDGGFKMDVKIIQN